MDCGCVVAYGFSYFIDVFQASFFIKTTCYCVAFTYGIICLVLYSNQGKAVAGCMN